MRSPILFTTLFLTSLVSSLPAAPATPSTPAPTPAALPPLTSAPLGLSIHGSCSTIQTRQIIAGLKDTEEFVFTALTHLHTYGQSSAIFKKYFGTSPTAEVIGWFSRILYAAKPGALFRCDDVDGNCARDHTWAGHHRGSNATEETVICPPSYTLRLPLTKFCADGHTVAGNKTNVFWASDLLHRLLHVPGVSEEAVLHYSDGYQEVLDWAKETKNETVVQRRTKNSDGVIYFALEAYAETVVPGGGCVGVPVVKSEEKPVAKVEDKKEDKKEEAKDCHSHDDGTIHCV